MKVAENGMEEQLLVEAAQQDPSRFAELYENNFDRVYAYVARRVRDRDEAEDLTSEVFHQALASLGRFEWRGVPFVAWLIGIAAKVIAHRWQDAAQHPEAPPEALDEAACEGDAERHATFVQLVEALPPDQRLVVIRRFVDQNSVREIAQELQRTEGAVKQLQFRALQSLRGLIRSTQ